MRYVAEQKKENEEQCKRNSERVVKVDEWWIVADAGFSLNQTQMETLDKAVRLAEDNGINLLVDRPSFGYWVLLSAIETSKYFDNANDLAVYTKSQLRAIGCGNDTSSLLERLGNAMVHAAVLSCSSRAIFTLRVG